MAPMIEPGAWKEEACVIVGGGISTILFDWEHLDPRLKLVAVSRAGEDIPKRFRVDLWVSADRPFWEAGRRRGDTYRVWVHPPGDAPLRGDGADWCIPWHGRQWAWSQPPTLEDGVACAGNSGHAALSLVLHLGADPIYLLGFDCTSGTWTSTKGRAPKQAALDRWMASSLRLAAWAAEQGRRVKWINGGAAAPQEELYGG